MSTYRAIPNFYDDEYAGHDILGPDIAYLLAKIRKPPSDVLMLACGTGRAAIPVAQAGHRVTGVDIDPVMIQIAAAKRDELGMGSQTLRFEVGDLLAWRTRARFDHAAILFNSFLVFTTLEQQDRVLLNAHRHLKRDGTLLIDIFNPDMARISAEDESNADVRIFHSTALGTTVQRVAHVLATDRPQVRETIFEYSWFDRNQKRRTKRIRFDITYHFEREMVLLLERNGFEIESVAGDYDGTAVAIDSPRIIVLARRR